MSKTAVNLSPDRILHLIQDGLLILDPGGRVLYANPTLQRILGRAGEELQGRTIQELFPEEVCGALDPENFREQEDGPAAHFNLLIPNEQGGRSSYCFTSFPVRDKQGRYVGVLQNFRGMDRLREMILDLEEVNELITREKERTEQVIDAIGDGVFTVDAERRIQSFSRRMQEITGLRSEDAVGSTCMEVLRGTRCESDCPLVWSLDEGKPVDGCREQLKPSSGNEISAEITTAFLYDDDDRVVGLTAFVADRSEVESLRRELEEIRSAHGIVGRSSPMHALFESIETVASTDATVLVSGESGTGKELVARAIHEGSPRSEGPFVAVNCAALTETLLESELFGHVRGAFTGALKDRPGRFEAAEGGTIFLDEIGEL